MTTQELNARINTLLIAAFKGRPEDLDLVRKFCQRYAALERAWGGASKILTDAGTAHPWAVLGPFEKLVEHQDEMDEWCEAWVAMRNLDAAIGATP